MIRLPLKLGLSLLGLLLLGLALVDGRAQLPLILLAMGVALWTALSLPHPGPKPEPPGLVQTDDEPDDAAEAATEAGVEASGNGMDVEASGNGTAKAPPRGEPQR